MRYKKLTSLFLTAILALSLASCGQTAAEENDSAQESGSASQQTDTATETGGQESGKTLVVYYSATDHTEAVANYIADALGADTFEVSPAELYTAEDLDWTEEGSRVNREHEDPSLRVMELTTDTVDNWEEYDTVFVGYPIWWGIAAWPMDNFVSANDFTGKTVIPFATSSSSGIGESGTLLAELAGTGTWLEGKRFPSNTSENEVTDWVNSLNLAD